MNVPHRLLECIKNGTFDSHDNVETLKLWVDKVFAIQHPKL